MTLHQHLVRVFRALLLSGGALVLSAGPAAAQRLDLSINPVNITFPPADPDTVPFVSSVPVDVSYRVRQWNGPWTITLLAVGDLISGPATVDISNVTWIATPAPPFQNGTMSKTVAQRLASGSGDVNPTRRGQITFRLANSWNQTAGFYTQTIVLTLTAP